MRADPKGNMNKSSIQTFHPCKEDKEKEAKRTCDQPH